MVKLLKETCTVENPYTIHNLHRCYQQYQQEKDTVQFSIEDLVEEGWLISYLGEWRLNAGI